MEGTRTKKVGNVTINCMSEEARSLLDRLCAKFKKDQGKDVRSVNGYQALYWACRYSGLIEPSEEEKEKEEND